MNSIHTWSSEAYGTGSTVITSICFAGFHVKIISTRNHKHTYILFPLSDLPKTIINECREHDIWIQTQPNHRDLLYPSFSKTWLNALEISQSSVKRHACLSFFLSTLEPRCFCLYTYNTTPDTKNKEIVTQKILTLSQLGTLRMIMRKQCYSQPIHC